MDSKLQFYGAPWCPECHDLKNFLGEHGIDYRWIDIDKSPEAAAKVADFSGGIRRIPALIFGDGSYLVEPSNAAVAEKLGISTKPEQEFNELAIIGAGPTGLSAAIYTTREDIKTTLYEKKIVGGQASITDLIDNYPGFPDGVGGIDLAEAMEKQAKRFGAQIKTGIEVTGIENRGRYKKLITNQGEQLTKSVLIAAGTDYRKLGVPGEKEFTSRGVHYCATCDGPFYSGKELIVVGGGNSAMQESIFLTKFASKITILVRGGELKGSEILIDKVTTMPKINVQYGFSSTQIERQGEKMVVYGVSNNGRTAQFSADGIFVFIGLLPNTGWLKGIVDLDPTGFILTDKTFETSMKGVFAAGDIRAGSTLQIASAVGEGVTAALMIREYLKEEG